MRQNTTTHRYDEAFKMNLQLFAAPEGGDGSAAEAGEGAGGSAGAEQNPAGGEERSYTRAEMQAEIDRVVEQRMARARRDEARRLAAAREEGRSEAQRLAQMTEEQRAEHARQQAERAAQEREDALARREAEITRRELRAQAVDTLIQRGLPRALEAVLVYTNAEACNASIDAVDKAFREAVRDGVNERLKQSGVTLKNGAAPDYDAMSDADYYAATYKNGAK